MHIVLGGTGNVGSALVRILLEQGQPVTVVTRRPEARAALEARGARVAIADIRDAQQLRQVLRTGERAFLLNPPADPATDTVAEERRTVNAILDAVRGSALDKVVAQSTCGARPGDGEGDLNVLYEFEQGLADLDVPASVVRGAYYMSNWDAALETARSDGVVHTLYPSDFALPMVAPADLGRVAAQLITSPPDDAGIHEVEGPERYTPADVAAAFAEALGRSVEAVVVPREEWEASFEALGFSRAAAASYAAMTAATLAGGFADPARVERGTTSLQQYITALVARGGHRD